jgi:hypothetical protein
MIRTLAGLLLCLAGALPAAAAPDAPAALHGKSVVVTWSEARVQRNLGDKNFRPVFGNQKLSVYISSAGRVFNRFTNATRAGTGSTEQVAGSGGANRVPSFEGQSMHVMMPFESGGARHVDVEFSATFGDCSAKVSHEPLPGKAHSLGFSPITKKWIEFESIAPLDPKCALQDGNVFGEN